MRMFLAVIAAVFLSIAPLRSEATDLPYGIDFWKEQMEGCGFVLESANILRLGHLLSDNFEEEIIGNLEEHGVIGDRHGPRFREMLAKFEEGREAARQNKDDAVEKMRLRMSIDPREVHDIYETLNQFCLENSFPEVIERYSN